MASTTRRRYMDRRVGLLVVTALALVVVAVLQSDYIRSLVSPSQELRVLLPETGVAGLSRGSSVEILGTPAGSVTEIVIRPGERFHAVVEIDDRMAAFLARDSDVLIKRQFGIAGAAYMEITRGSGDPLDWDFAVLTARTERAPTDNIGELVDDLRSRIFPIIDETHRTLTAVAVLAERVERGEGTIGTLLTDDTLVTELEGVAAEARGGVGEIAALIADLRATSGQLAALGERLNDGRSGVPAILDRVNAAVDDINATIGDLRTALPDVKRMAGNAATASEEVPTLVAQTQLTLKQLERLMVTLQNNWLISGGGPRRPSLGEPLDASEVRR